MSTFRAIASRLAVLDPPLHIENHIAQREWFDGGRRTQFSTLESFDSTLDGIDFVAKDSKHLADLLYNAKDNWGQRSFASMREDPDHWALKKSFAKTVGTGWRESWRPAPISPPGSIPARSGEMDNSFRMRFGNAGVPIRYTALHWAVDNVSGNCNVHIDERGFVLELPSGISLTPDFYGHWMEELNLKPTSATGWREKSRTNGLRNLSVSLSAACRLRFLTPPMVMPGWKAKSIPFADLSRSQMVY